MIISNTITKAIDQNLIQEDEKRKKEWGPSSGKLSASRLSWPLQWQILKHLNVETSPIDAYTLRKFKRGRDIEDWLVEQIPGLTEAQKFVEYKQTVGYVDAMVDMTNYDVPFVDVIPHEIKSVTNAKFKWIQDFNAPDDGHILQACLYAMATGSKYFAVDYVASDDLRVKCYILETKQYSDRVDNIISEYQSQLKKKEIPVFKPMYGWQSNIKYNNYPEWAGLSEEEIKEKCERLGVSFK